MTQSGTVQGVIYQRENPPQAKNLCSGNLVSDFCVSGGPPVIWLKSKCNLKYTFASLCLPGNININQLVPFMRVLGNLGLYSLQLGSLMDPLHKLVAHCSNNPHTQCVPILSEVAFIFQCICVFLR